MRQPRIYKVGPHGDVVIMERIGIRNPKLHIYCTKCKQYSIIHQNKFYRKANPCKCQNRAVVGIHKNPYIYHVYRRYRANWAGTEWDTFPKFLASVGPKPRGKFLIARECDKPMSPSNYAWGPNKSHTTPKYNVKVNGLAVTLPQAAKMLGVSRQFLYQMKDIGKLEQWIKSKEMENGNVN